MKVAVNQVRRAPTKFVKGNVYKHQLYTDVFMCVHPPNNMEHILVSMTTGQSHCYISRADLKLYTDVTDDVVLCYDH